MQQRKDCHPARLAGAAAGMILLMLVGGAGARPPHTGNGATAAAKIPALSGEIGGTWSQVPDQGGSFRLSGNGDVAPLGPVQVAGSLRPVGGGTGGQTTGTVTLTGAQGALTLALSGPSGPSAALTFTVTGSTGAYQGQRGTGLARLTMTPQRRPATVPGRMTPHFIVAAMFSLTFGDAPGHSGSQPAQTGHG